MQCAQTRIASVGSALTRSDGLAVGAIFLDAVSVNLQRMIVDGEAAFLSNALLALLDFSVNKLFDFAALQTDQMIVVVAMIEFEYRLVAIKVVAHQ
jgi:hypothetical protein